MDVASADFKFYPYSRPENYGYFHKDNKYEMDENSRVMFNISVSQMFYHQYTHKYMFYFF